MHRWNRHGADEALAIAPIRGAALRYVLLIGRNKFGRAVAVCRRREGRVTRFTGWSRPRRQEPFATASWRPHHR